MERLTKRYNERTGTYEYIDAFSGAGILDTIVKAVTSTFAKDTAKTIATKALEAGVSKFGSEIGTRAANKVISAVDDKFSKPTKIENLIIPKSIVKLQDLIIPKSLKVDSDNKSSKPLENVIMKEWNKKSSEETINLTPKKQYYGYGNSKRKTNKQFQNKLNKLLK